MSDDELASKIMSTLDKDDSGYLDKKELKALLCSGGQKITKSKLDELMKNIDENGDGKISHSELKKLLAQMGGGGGGC